MSKLNKRNGFSLMELIVVLIIVGVLATLVVPSFATSIERSRAQDAINNLMAIYTGQLDYRNNTGGYCVGACTITAAPPGGLGLSIVVNGFTYACVTGVAGDNGFSCTALRDGGATTLTLNNNPIVLTGGARNPSCVSTNNACPQ